MRLYLASSRTGDAFPELLRMAGPGARVAVVSNAVDFIPDADRAAYARNVSDPVAEFRAAGFDAYDLDLRGFFRRPQALLEELERTRLVWATGGNAFLLRRAMRQSGFDAIAPGLIWAGRLVYGGWSAGACVAAPSLRGLEIMDDPAVLADGYDPGVVWEGLGLVDAAIVPHYRSDHAEAEAAGRAAAWMAENRVPHRTLRDGDVLIQNGEMLELHAGRP
ncbi:MAG: Type 1 glutamine amidotransferase-like domain-containing protein [Phenylobacterium sp.]|uniref:Type 1 glutamine amidotransferase-like domain-containing protein n=1 Tax=Phenylobacterium sp. TaxID=1871053 RepID=UPI001A486609|nr:Type 1 glutamine amidotransferase-like domain-containing protein [Phenylobacterium sp.]MBL8770568.1 Type 1 glutamine amidotransferase-like domain-containing protein [Phenylobacterium sp.]